MDRHLVISSDCHAGLPPEQYRDYLDPQHREAFDAALPIQIEQTKLAEKTFLITDINEDWRDGREEGLRGAWDHDQRLKVLDGDGIAGEIGARVRAGRRARLAVTALVVADHASALAERRRDPVPDFQRIDQAVQAQQVRRSRWRSIDAQFGIADSNPFHQ